ncbi:MAG: LysR family transcriptional regulator [Alphaproteobacteria bacterium]|nr:LysR family transcriptional regulator [Alphaproteobacteria bacterium]
MDWNSAQFDWNRLRAFLVTAEEGSLSAAARALGSTQPTMGRQVAALEEELGVTLFERVGARLELTESGFELLEHARPMGQAALQVSLAAAGRSEVIAGEVSLTASEAISAFLLPPVLAGLRRTHPGIQVELVASNVVRDLHRREADIAVRNARPTSPDLTARRLPDRTGGFYASAAYLDRVGPLDRLADLSRAEILAFDRTPVFVDMLRGAGADVTPAHFPIACGNHLVQWQLCRQGLGLCVMMHDVGDADPAVVRVVPEFAVPVQMWLVCHRELRTSRRLRIVFDALAEGLS